jgi:RNA polymerase sigma-70 factor (ECF subfamily)
MGFLLGNRLLRTEYQERGLAGLGLGTQFVILASLQASGQFNRCLEQDVNSRSELPSTQVMATMTTVLESMGKPLAAVPELEFAVVAGQYRQQIFRFLLSSLRDPDAAETLTQDCLLKAHRNWASFRGESSVMTWLLRIAINLQKDHWRSRRMQFWKQTNSNAVDAEDAAQWLPSGESSPEQQVVAKDQVRLVWKAVEGLSERQRTVFMLRHVEEMDIQEIANTIGLSEGTVKAHLSRAMGRVRTELGGKR